MTDPTTETAARERLADMIRTDRGDMNVYSESEVRAALDAYRDAVRAAVSAVSLPPADQTAPSRRAGLRDEIAAAVVRLHESGGLYALDAGEDGRIADAVLTVLYRERPWLRAEAEDAAPADQTAELIKLVTRSIFALKTPSPDGSKHYQSGWDDGLEAAMDAARDALAAVLPATTDQTADERIEQAEADAELHARNTEAVARERESYRAAWKDEQRRRAEAEAELKRLRADRAAVLREGADALALDRDATAGARAGARQGMTRAITLLRRMADETPAAETEAVERQDGSAS